jgi:hypothetical protein
MGFCASEGRKNGMFAKAHRRIYRKFTRCSSRAGQEDIHLARADHYFSQVRRCASQRNFRANPFTYRKCPPFASNFLNTGDIFDLFE